MPEAYISITPISLFLAGIDTIIKTVKIQMLAQHKTPLYQV